MQNDNAKGKMMAGTPDNTNLPQCAAEYVELVVKKMGYRRKVRAEAWNYSKNQNAKSKTTTQRAKMV
jgi:hypothetical protein